MTEAFVKFTFDFGDSPISSAIVFARRAEKLGYRSFLLGASGRVTVENDSIFSVGNSMESIVTMYRNLQELKQMVLNDLYVYNTFVKDMENTQEDV